MKTLRGACVGAGYFSHYQYEAWQRMPEVEIVALANRSIERGREVAARYHVPRVYPIHEFERMLREQKPDFVDLITPPETHADLVAAAAAQGVAIICQKPLAPTWEQSVAVVETAR